MIAGCGHPSYQVLAVALNSGLAVFPTAFERAWACEGVSFWRPLPPPGYVALGLLATPDGEEAPGIKSVVCLHAACVVEGQLGECLLSGGGGALWALQNGCGTFEAAPPGAHVPRVPLYDLRSPLGVLPTALTPLGGAAAGGSEGGAIVPAAAANGLPPSLRVQRRFLEQRQERLSHAAFMRFQSSTVEFARIWRVGGCRCCSAALAAAFAVPHAFCCIPARPAPCALLRPRIRTLLRPPLTALAPRLPNL
jgi:hypothetical protein